MRRTVVEPAPRQAVPAPDVDGLGTFDWLCAYGWWRSPGPVRSEVEELPPLWAPGAGVGAVLPVPADVPPTDGVAAGLRVGRSDWEPEVPYPGPGAAGAPGLTPAPEAEPLRGGDVVAEGDVRFKAA